MICLFIQSIFFFGSASTNNFTNKLRDETFAKQAHKQFLTIELLQTRSLLCILYVYLNAPVLLYWTSVLLEHLLSNQITRLELNFLKCIISHLLMSSV